MTPSVAKGRGVERSSERLPVSVRDEPGQAAAPGASPIELGIRSFDAEFVDRLDSLHAMRGELDNLLERTGAPASARWAAISTGLAHDSQARPWCVVVRNGPVVAGAVLATARKKLGAWFLQSASHPEEQGWLAALDSAASEALAVALSRSLQRLRLPWFLELRHLPEADPTVSALRAVLEQATTLPASDIPRLSCGEDSRLESCLSRNTRSVVSRARKRIEAAGLRCEMAWIVDPEEIDACLDDLIDVHRRRNRQLRGFAGLDDPRKRALFMDTVRAQADAGRARLLTLRLAGALAAFAICFEASGKLYVYSNMAAPDWLDFSPGTIANAEVVLAALRDPGVHCVDWGAGLQRYKLSGENVRVHHLHHFHAWSSTSFRLAWTFCHRTLHG